MNTLDPALSLLEGQNIWDILPIANPHFSGPLMGFLIEINDRQWESSHQKMASVEGAPVKVFEKLALEIEALGGVFPCRVFISLKGLLSFKTETLILALETLGKKLRNSPLQLVITVPQEVFESPAHHMEQLLPVLRVWSIGLAISGISEKSEMGRFASLIAVDYVFVEETFFENAFSEPNLQIVWASFLSLLNRLKIKTIISGVHTEAQRLFLQQHVCEGVMGRLVGHRFFGHLSGPLTFKKIAEQQASYQQQASVAVERMTAAYSILLIQSHKQPLPFLSLKGGNFRTLYAAEVKEAWHHLNHEAIDLIVTDHAALEETLRNFSVEVRQYLPDIPHILLSRKDHLDEALALLNEGFLFRVVFKPYLCGQVEQVIEQALEHRQLLAHSLVQRHDIEITRTKLAESHRYIKQILAEKADRLRRDETHLSVSQETIFRLPALIFGIDEEGMLVLSNAMAQNRFPAARLLGIYVEEFLPPLLLGLLSSPREEIVCLQDLENGVEQSFRVHVIFLGNAHKVRGKVLMMIPFPPAGEIQ